MEGEGSDIADTLPVPVSSPPSHQAIVRIKSRVKNVVRHFNSKHTIALGVSQILLGFTSCVLDIVDNSLFVQYRGYNLGLWSSVFILLSGAVAIAAGMKKSYALIIAHVICLSIATLVACIMLGFAIAFINSAMKDEQAYGSVVLCILWLSCSIALFLCCLWGLGVRIKAAVCLEYQEQRRSSIQLVNRQSSRQSNPAAEAVSRT